MKIFKIKIKKEGRKKEEGGRKRSKTKKKC
jgi:hypothetical protein